MYSIDEFWMMQAFMLAKDAEKANEVPVGAVLVDAQGKKIASAYNQVRNAQDSTAHAEIICIRKGCEIVNNHVLSGTTLYVTLEPCPMCAGALVHARIKRLVFAARDFKTGAAGSVMNLLKGDPLNHRMMIDEGIMQSQCAHLLDNFFATKR